MRHGEGKLRVTQVVHRFWPEIGGIETHVWEVSRRLVGFGVEVTVLTTDRTGELPTSETVEGVQIRRVRSYPRERDYYLAPSLPTAIAASRPDIVHAQGVHTFAPPVTMGTALRRKLPYVLTFHSGGNSSGFRTGIRDVQWKVLAPLLRRADLLIGVSKFEAESFGRILCLPADRMPVIRNGGTLPPEVSPQPTAADRAPLIMSIGRLEHYKGHHRLIEALPRVREVHANASVKILGSGPYEQNLRRLARDLGVDEAVDIEFVPGGDRGRMASVVGGADLVTMFSDYEAHPVAVMEAVALRRPVLVSATSGLTELADEGLCSAIPQGATPAQTADAIVAALAKPVLPPEDYALPTWDTCAAQLLERYREVYARRVLGAEPDGP